MDDRLVEIEQALRRVDAAIASMDARLARLEAIRGVSSARMEPGRLSPARTAPTAPPISSEPTEHLPAIAPVVAPPIIAPALTDEVSMPSPAREVPIAVAAPANKAAALQSLLELRRDGHTESTPDRSTPEAFELLIGGTWLNRIGAVVLLLGIGFFVKYSFEQGWIGPLTRVLIGGGLGIGLIAAGEVFIRRQQRNFAAGLLGAGIGTLYFSAYAAHHFYGLIELEPAFVIFCVITTIGAVVAAHGRIQAVAVLALLGGIWTPLALSTSRNAQIALMTYLLLLDTAFLCVGNYRRWNAVRLVAWAGTAFLFFGWCWSYYEVATLHRTLAFLAAFSGLFHAEAIIAALRADRSTGACALVIKMNNAACFAAAYLLAEPAYPEWMGLMCIVGAAINWLPAHRLRSASHADATRMSLWLSGAWMLALFAPLQFDGRLVPITWSVQGAVTLWFCRKNPSTGLRMKGVAVFLLAIAHLFQFDFGDPTLRSNVFTSYLWHWNGLLTLFLAVALCLHAGAAVLVVRRERQDADVNVAAYCITAGIALLLYITAWEFDRYVATWHWMGLAAAWAIIGRVRPGWGIAAPLIIFVATAKFLGYDLLHAAATDQWRVLSGLALNRAVFTGLALAACMLWTSRQLRRPGSSSLADITTDAANVALLSTALIIWATGTFEIIRVLRFEPLGVRFTDPDLAMHVALSVFWSIEATALLAIGFIRLNRPLRLEAIVLFAVTVGKVMLVDLSHLQTLYRIISFVVLGVLLLAASWMYTRVSGRLKPTPAQEPASQPIGSA